MAKNQLLLKKREIEIRRKELEETRKCEEEVAHRRKINAARAELEIKHFEEKQGKKEAFLASFAFLLDESHNYSYSSTFSATILAMRKMLSNRASDELKQRAMRECEIFERDVRLQHQKAKEKAESARKKLEQERIAIDESRRQQLQCKMQDKEAEKKLGELYAKELARITTQKQDLERQKELEKRKQSIELRQQQQQQIRETERRRNKEEEEKLKEEKQVSSAQPISFQIIAIQSTDTRKSCRCFTS